MKGYLVDTNLFIRYLTNDDQERADRVDRLLQDAASGEVRLVTAEMVIAEIVWVLESAYGLKSSGIAPLIRAILATPGLDVINAALVERALFHYETVNIDFIDGYIAAVMEKRGLTRLYSFDKKHISRLPGVERMKP
ncbi:MAG: type II toxin-antitoxin system VapC family toxin [Nitrospirales bacterium]|nr:type II toxin-antitoxin system VapC family toxin [Nitrospirales bacterium]